MATTFIFANNVKTTLATALTNSGTTVTLASSANLPTLAAGQMMPLTLTPASSPLSTVEIVYVTAISGANLTVIRAQEGTTAQAWGVGDIAFSDNTAGTTVPMPVAATPSNKVVYLPSGNTTSMPFFQASAPVGWTQNTTINDQVLRVVSGSGGGTGGSWSVTGFTAANHTHSDDHAHIENGLGNNNFSAGGGGGDYTGSLIDSGVSTTALKSTSGYGTTTGATQPGVSNDGSWRPAYIDVIVCSLN